MKKKRPSRFSVNVPLIGPFNFIVPPSTGHSAPFSVADAIYMPAKPYNPVHLTEAVVHSSV